MSRTYDVIKWPLFTVTHRLRSCLRLTFMNLVAVEKHVELWINVAIWNYCETVLCIRERQAKRKGSLRGSHCVLRWGELPLLLANAGSGGGAWEITRKWAMGIRLRWVLQQLFFQVHIEEDNETTSHSLMFEVTFKMIFLACSCCCWLLIAEAP